MAYVIVALVFFVGGFVTGVLVGRKHPSTVEDLIEAERKAAGAFRGK